jgi:hypothetical protein
MLAGKVIIVEQVAPADIIVLKNGSELLYCARPHKFLICSLPAKRMSDLIFSGAISSAHGGSIALGLHQHISVVFPREEPRYRPLSLYSDLSCRMAQRLAVSHLRHKHRVDAA